MDILLLSITIVSLIVAAIMSVVAWRLSREGRARGAARIAALAAAARDDHPSADGVVHQPALSSTASSAAPATLAAPAVPVALWSPPRQRSRAADEFPEEGLPSSPDRRVPPQMVENRPPARRTTSHETIGDAFLGGSVAAAPGNSRQRGLAVAAVALLFAAAVTGGYYLVSGNTSASVTTTTDVESPLELISLRHERKAGELSISGLVRNPSGAEPLDRLAAVVFLFNQAGELIASARAGVDYTRLTPGDESPFVLRVSAPANVARYRVSFRDDDGVVPHVDRRGQEPIARELP